MKWIGQHIWDFVSRFRNDIYIVNKETGKEHKITTSLGDVDVVVPSSFGSTGGIRFLNEYQDDPVFDFNVSRAQFNIKDDSGGGNPSMLLQTGVNLASGTSLTFTKARLSGGSIVAGVDDDIINTIYYKSYNDAGTPEIITFAQVLASIKDASDTDEAGKYEIKVATSDGSTSALQNAFSANGHGTNDIVSTTIGYGAASVVTVPGVLSALSGITFDGVALTTIQTSAESFADNDTSLMTSAAIDDRIAAAGGGVSVSDSTANTDFPVVFHDESNNLHDDTGAFTYNPSTGLLTSGKGTITSLRTDGIELGHASDTSIARLAAGIVTVEGEEVVTTLTRSLTSEGVGVPLALMQARRTLTEAEMNDLHNTPITIVPAQGANTVIVPMEAMLFIDRDSSTAQSTGASLLFSWDGNNSYATDALLYQRRFMYNEGGDRIWNMKAGYSGEVGSSLTAGTNKPVKAVVDSAITSGSIDSMDVYLTYYVLDIS